MQPTKAGAPDRWTRALRAAAAQPRGSAGSSQGRAGARQRQEVPNRSKAAAAAAVGGGSRGKRQRQAEPADRSDTGAGGVSDDEGGSEFQASDAGLPPRVRIPIVSKLQRSQSPQQQARQGTKRKGRDPEVRLPLRWTWCSHGPFTACSSPLRYLLCCNLLSV